ncbi:MAG: hypothetical protein K2I87_01665 [Bacteroidales bacterium]|nr:hypothetical protein [Bacteroidales bacterium]
MTIQNVFFGFRGFQDFFADNCCRISNKMMRHFFVFIFIAGRAVVSQLGRKRKNVVVIAIVVGDVLSEYRVFSDKQQKEP